MLSRSELDHLCRLSRLELPEEEAARLLEDLEAIVGYVAALAELDTREAPAALDPMQDGRAWREDRIEASDVEAALRNSPALVDGHFAVPPVVIYGAGGRFERKRGTEAE